MGIMAYESDSISINGLRADALLHHYWNSFVKFKIIRYLKNRELSLLKAKVDGVSDKINIRNLRCHNVQQLDFLLARLKAFKHEYGRPKIYNLYYSLAEFRNGMPFQNLAGDKWQERKSLISDFNKVAHLNIVAYDCMIDIDAAGFDDIGAAWDSADAVRSFMDLHNCPYHLRFTGRGFCFIIPFRFFKGQDFNFELYHEKSIYKLFSQINEFFYDKFSEMTDTGLNDHRRLVKIPYSLSIYNEGAFMCAPMQTSNEFADFSIDKYRLQNIKWIFESPSHAGDEHIFNKDGNLSQLLDEIKKYRVKKK